MKKPLIFSLLWLVAGIHAGHADATPTPLPKPPRSWYFQPASQEEHGSRMVASARQLPDSPSTSLGELTREIFRSSLGSMKRMRSTSASSPWQLEYFTTELGITVDGLFGILGIKGTPAISAFWRKKEAKQLILNPEDDATRDEAQSRETLRLSAEKLGAAGAIDPWIASQLEPSLKALLASGRATHEAKLRKSLMKHARKFIAMAQEAGSAIDPENSSWYVSEIRTDLSISASGEVDFGTSAEAGLALRLVWIPTPRLNSPAASTASTPSLNPLIGRLAQALADAEREKEVIDAGSNGFRLHRFKAGFGISATGDLGIVQEGASAAGHIVLARKPDATPKRAPASGPFFRQSQEKLLLIHSSRDANPFPIDQEAFKKGLIKAIGIGDFFASAGLQAQEGEWKVYKLETSFNLSMTGDVGLASVKQIASIAFDFRNMNF